MLVPDTYRDIIAKKGYPLTAIGINQIALSREDALAALATLNGSQIAVLGGDVYRMEGNAIRPTPDSWYVERKASEPLSDYLKRTRDAARKFVETYPDPSASRALASLGAHGVYLEKFPASLPQDSSVLFTLELSELGVTPVIP